MESAYIKYVCKIKYLKKVSNIHRVCKQQNKIPKASNFTLH